MIIGFDQVYVVVVDGYTLFNECIYDIQEARQKVKEAKNEGYTNAREITLEDAIYDGYRPMDE